jgi:hypothetical protein
LGSVALVAGAAHAEAPELFVTVRLADALAEPPAPVQVSVKLVVPADVIVPVAAVPLVALVPLQPPDALQDVALVEDQVRVADLPVVVEVGLTLNATVGGGVAGLTVRRAEALAVPPAPVQVSVKLVAPADVIVPVDAEPLLALPLYQVRGPPEARQEVALVEDQVRVADLPVVMEAGLTLNATVGGIGAGLTVRRAESLALPPAPVQVSVKLVVPADVIVPVDAEPPPTLPLYQVRGPPEALQEVALMENQIRVADRPTLMVAGFTFSMTVGATGPRDTWRNGSLVSVSAIDDVMIGATVKLAGSDA